jgi:hypothetical protein
MPSSKEKAEQLKAASVLSRAFLSHPEPEFRTPLNSVLALARLLLDRSTAALAGAEMRQIGYIRRGGRT